MLSHLIFWKKTAMTWEILGHSLTTKQRSQGFLSFHRLGLFFDWDDPPRGSNDIMGYTLVI